MAANSTSNGRAPAGNVTITDEARTPGTRTPRVKPVAQVVEPEPEPTPGHFPGVELPELDIDPVTGYTMLNVGQFVILVMDTDRPIMDGNTVSRTSGGFAKIANSGGWMTYPLDGKRFGMQLTVIDKTDKKTTK